MCWGRGVRGTRRVRRQPWEGEREGADEYPHPRGDVAFRAVWSLSQGYSGTGPRMLHLPLYCAPSFISSP